MRASLVPFSRHELSFFAIGSTSECDSRRQAMIRRLRLATSAAPPIGRCARTFEGAPLSRMSHDTGCRATFCFSAPPLSENADLHVDKNERLRPDLNRRRRQFSRHPLPLHTRMQYSIITREKWRDCCSRARSRAIRPVRLLGTRGERCE